MENEIERKEATEDEGEQQRSKKEDWGLILHQRIITGLNILSISLFNLSIALLDMMIAMNSVFSVAMCE